MNLPENPVAAKYLLRLFADAAAKCSVVPNYLGEKKTVAQGWTWRIFSYDVGGQLLIYREMSSPIPISYIHQQEIAWDQFCAPNVVAATTFPTRSRAGSVRALRWKNGYTVLWNVYQWWFSRLRRWLNRRRFLKAIKAPRAPS